LGVRFPRRPCRDFKFSAIAEQLPENFLAGGTVRVRCFAVRADGLRYAIHLSNHPSRARRSPWRRVRCAATAKRSSRSRTRTRSKAPKRPRRSPPCTARSNPAPRTRANTARSTSRRCPPGSRQGIVAGQARAQQPREGSAAEMIAPWQIPALPDLTLIKFRLTQLWLN
jgi:hypothetical protein